MLSICYILYKNNQMRVNGLENNLFLILVHPEHVKQISSNVIEDGFAR